MLEQPAVQGGVGLAGLAVSVVVVVVCCCVLVLTLSRRTALVQLFRTTLRLGNDVDGFFLFLFVGFWFAFACILL